MSGFGMPNVDWGWGPQVAYHQTDETGLKGILSTRRLWARRMHLLAGQEEFSSMDTLFKTLDGQKSNPEFRSLAALIDGVIGHVKEEIEGEQHLRFYVACFSAPNRWTGTVLPQWLPGRQYALELSGQDFADALRNHGLPRPAFIEVCYDEGTQRRVIEQQVQKALRDPLYYTADLDFRAQVYHVGAQVGSTPFYHKKFNPYSSESEWRAAINVHDKSHDHYLSVENHTGGNRVELPFEPGVLRAVHWRTTAALSGPQIEGLLAAHGWAGVPVRDCDALPFVSPS